MATTPADSTSLDIQAGYLDFSNGTYITDMPPGSTITSLVNNPVGTLVLYKDVYVAADGTRVDALVMLDELSPSARVIRFDSTEHQYKSPAYFQPNVFIDPPNSSSPGGYAKFHVQFIKGGSFDPSGVTDPATGEISPSSVRMVTVDPAIALYPGEEQLEINGQTPYDKVTIYDSHFIACDIDGNSEFPSARQYVEAQRYEPGTETVYGTPSKPAEVAISYPPAGGVRFTSTTGDDNTANPDTLEGARHSGSVDLGPLRELDLSVGDTSTTNSYSAFYALAFAAEPNASIGDYLWFDSNANGQQDAGEAGVAGRTVTLLSGGIDEILGTEDDSTITTVTDSNGKYSFLRLTPGVEYQVQFGDIPSGYVFTTPNAAPDTVDSDADPATGKAKVITLAPDENNTSIDAGVRLETPGIKIIKDASQTTVPPNTPVTFTYSVSNTGGTSLTDISVVDDGATPAFQGDDFNPTPILSNGKNIGDVDLDNALDPREIWKYSATVIPPLVMTVKVTSTSSPLSSGTISYKTLANGDIRVFYRQDLNFNDNTYGTGTEGWMGRTHTFSNLTGSDKCGWLIKYADGSTMAQFYQDYISSSGSASGGYSGYQSLGFSGGDGKWVAGDTSNQAFLKDFDSTLELNLNQGGSWSRTRNGAIVTTPYASMIVDSPTGSNVTSGDPTPGWDKIDGYYFTISKDAFATKGFGGVTIFDQHNSPAKTGSSNTYIPEIVYSGSVNTATVTGKDVSTLLSHSSSATVDIKPDGGGGGTPVKDLFVVDSGSDKTYAYKPDGSATNILGLNKGNGDARDIASNTDASQLWVLDKNDKVFVYNGTSGALLSSWTASGTGDPDGISVDGASLWLADRSDKLYWFKGAATSANGSTDSPEKTFAPTMSGTLKGIVTDGNLLWAITEGGTDYLYRYLISRDGTGTPTGLNQNGLWKLPSSNSKPTGITLDPTGVSQSLWIVDDSNDSVYEYANARSLAANTSTTANATVLGTPTTFKLASGNTAPQGIAEPVSVYELNIVPTGVRSASGWTKSSMRKFWDGINGNEPAVTGQSPPPNHDLLFANYIDFAVAGQVQDPVTGTYRAGVLLGDYNRSGTTDVGEQTLFYSLDQAVQLLKASRNSQGSNKDNRYALAGELVASWLNYIAGNPIDTADTSDKDARYYINSGISWLKAVTPDVNGDNRGDGALDQMVGSSVSSPRVNQIWTTPLETPAVLPDPYNSNSEEGFPLDAGSAIFAGLRGYNTGLGLADGVFVA